MMGSLFKRLFESLCIFWIVITITFYLLQWTPGRFSEREQHPVHISAQNASSNFNIDQSPSYKQFVVEICKGNLGYSWQFPEKTVLQLLRERIPFSLASGILSICMMALGGVALGIVAAWNPYSTLDRLVSIAAMTGVCFPPFILGPILLMLLSRSTHLSIFGTSTPLWLPCVIQAYFATAYVAKLTRNHLVEHLSMPYVQAAYARGISKPRLFAIHLLKHSLPGIMSYLGPTTAIMLSGSIVVESLFNLPGAGSLFIQAVYERDQPVILGTVLYFAFLMILLNVLADTILNRLHPKKQPDLC